ncbi:hypothetical protein TWF281_004983 [Arthrobotrys megalospora]
MEPANWQKAAKQEMRRHPGLSGGGPKSFGAGNKALLVGSSPVASGEDDDEDEVSR